MANAVITLTPIVGRTPSYRINMAEIESQAAISKDLGVEGPIKVVDVAAGSLAVEAPDAGPNGSSTPPGEASPPFAVPNSSGSIQKRGALKEDEEFGVGFGGRCCFLPSDASLLRFRSACRRRKSRPFSAQTRSIEPSKRTGRVLVTENRRKTQRIRNRFARTMRASIGRDRKARWK